MKRLCAMRGLLLCIGFGAGMSGLGSPVWADWTVGTPTNLGPVVNSDADVAGVCVSHDGLSLYFCSNRERGYGSYDLWVATRKDMASEWGEPVNLGPTVNSSAACMAPSISADGLALYFSDFETPTYYGPLIPGGVGDTDIWVITRDRTDGPWSAPMNLGVPVNHIGGNICPSISAGGLTLYFCCGASRGGSGLYDIWVARRKSVEDPWDSPTNLGPMVNTADADAFPCVSADDRVLFFCSGSSLGSYDLYVSQRKSAEDSWGKSVELVEGVNTNWDELFPSISSDGRTLCFVSSRPRGYGQAAIWQAPLIPIVDFSGGGTVDIRDLLRLIESWGKDDPLVDVGPMPWGDGTVDEKDLEVLMSYWGQEVNDPTLAAGWKLDEMEGMVAHDIAGRCDGTLHGEPVWQPEGGKIGGSLLLDGSNDYVSTAFVLDPAAGPFSVLAWVKGDTPGQAILSQKNGVNWLLADTSQGKLMTNLSAPAGRNPAKPLVSESVITDGQWHRVGLVWDGSNRILYVDGAEVARDTQASLTKSTGGLCIGAGASLGAGTFWHGLIDDARIYNRVVRP